jgi:hypothetical protein
MKDSAGVSDWQEVMPDRPECDALRLPCGPGALGPAAGEPLHRLLILFDYHGDRGLPAQEPGS